MFDTFQKRAQSLMLVVMIAMLAVLFGTQFGPGTRQGCNPQQMTVYRVARVHGRDITEPEFRSRLRFVGNSRGGEASQQVRDAVVNGLVERELLAHEAERLGFRIDDAQLNHEIVAGFVYTSSGSSDLDMAAVGATSLSARIPTTYRFSDSARPATPGAFDYENFERWIRIVFGQTVAEYKESLARELLAEAMRASVASNVRVSEDEVWSRYEHAHTQTAVRYIPFALEFYRALVRDADAATLEAFAQSHATELTQQWEQRRSALQHLPAQVRVRQIFIRFPNDAEEPAKIATVQRAESLRARIEGGEDFVRLARLYSQDDSGWRTGSESGWATVDSLRVDDATIPDDVKRAIATLQPGALSPVIRSATGVHLVQLLARREGDVAEADARRDIARELYRESRAAELLREAADQTGQRVRAPGASLDAVAAALHEEALRAFYGGEVPASIVLAGNNTLDVVSHSDSGAPELRESLSFSRGEVIPGILDSAPIAQRAFELTDEHPVMPEVQTAGEDRYVVALRAGSRQNASREDFARERASLMQAAAASRQRDALQQYIVRLRAQAEHDGNLRAGNSPLLRRAPERDAEDPARGRS